MKRQVLISCCIVSLSAAAMDLTSPAFRDGGNIPVKYSCDGQGVSPPLAWTGVPSQTQALAVIVEDPDAPSGVFTHWVVFGIQPTVDHLDERVASTRLPSGAMQGRNSSGNIGWFAPCPPGGTHHYVFRLYAINTPFELKEGAERSDVEDVIRGHVLAETKLTGLYSRVKK